MKLSADKARLTFESKDQTETVLRLRPVVVTNKMWTGVDQYIKELCSKHFASSIELEQTDFVFVISPAGHRMTCPDIFRMLGLPEEVCDLRDNPLYGSRLIDEVYASNWQTVLNDRDSAVQSAATPLFRSYYMDLRKDDPTYPWSFLTFAVLQPDVAVSKFIAITSFTR